MGLSLGLLSSMGLVWWLPALEGVSPGSFVGREFGISMKEKVFTGHLPLWEGDLRRLSPHPPAKAVIIYSVYGSHEQYN